MRDIGDFCVELLVLSQIISEGQVMIHLSFGKKKSIFQFTVKSDKRIEKIIKTWRVMRRKEAKVLFSSKI